jgi:rod shape-determining protein MreC
MVAYRRSGRRRSVLVLLIVTSLLLITLDARGGGGVVGPVRNAARDLLSPAQNAVEDLTRPIGDWWDGTFSAGELASENRALRREVGRLRGEVSASRAARRENERLRANQGLPFITGIASVPAEVVAASPGNFEDTIAIDRGSRDGIAIGMPVVAGEGVVGRVSGVSRTRATIQLVTDPASGIGVRFVTSNTFAVAQGRAGSDQLRVDFVAPETPVARGEMLVTSGLQNAAYPAGLPVASVTSVDRTRRNLDQTILAEPMVDLARLQFVRVLIWTGTGSAG